VAAASVLAKVERDAMMVALDGEHSVYGWAENKGYAAPEHMLALEAHGPCVLHRRSWRLPGMPSLGELLEGGMVELSALDVRETGSEESTG
jgi:ribonuclease HII